MNKLVNQYNNAYYHSIGKKSVYVDYFSLTEENESSYKAPKFKVGDRVRIAKYNAKYNNIFSKGYTKKCSRKSVQP